MPKQLSLATQTDGGGRPAVGLERMLRIHFLQQWYALSDPAVEAALYDSSAMRRFVGIDLGRESAPDETTVCKCRNLLEKHAQGHRERAAARAHGGTETRQGVDPGGRRISRVLKRPFDHVKARLSGAGQERRPGADVVRAGQLMDGAQAAAGHDRMGAPERRIAAVKRGGAMQNERLMGVEKRRRRSSSGPVLMLHRPAGTGEGCSDHP